MKHISSGAGFSVVGMYLVSYVLLQYSGFFGPSPGNIMRVLHHWFALAGVAALVLYGLAWGYVHRAGKEVPDQLKKSITFLRLGYAGLMLCGLGILLSSLTRFEGRLALSEGQEALLAAESFDAGTIYQRKFSVSPQGSLLVSEVERFDSDKASDQGMPAARVLYRNAGSGESREFQVRSFIPQFHDGSVFTIRAAGYSPNIFLFDQGGDMIENFYAVLQLSPAGSEDMFRFDGIIPHTFYLRYYPEASLFPDVFGSSQIKSGPVFKVRIVRNLDIVADQYATPDSTVFFDKLIFTAGDVKKWVELLVVRDPGMYLLWPGLILVMCSATALAIRKYILKAGK